MISCLRGAGVEVVERHASVWERRRHKWSVGLGAAVRIGVAETRLLFGSRRERFDAVIVGYPGHFDVPAARRIARGRPVIFNPLVSLHETLVEDRGRFAAGSPAAGVLRQIDRLRAATRRSRRRRHGGERAPSRRAGRARRRAARGLLRRRRGAPLPARLAAGAGVPRPLRRQADPAPRPGDDPRRRPARARARGSASSAAASSTR